MTDVEHITLAQLQGLISTALAKAMPVPVWVCAEVADLKQNASGHCYIDLIQKSKTGATEAQARATIWRSQVASVVGRFEKESGLQLKKGMEILFNASVSHHAVYGISLQILQIDASFAIDEMERRRKETVERLKAEGIYELNGQTLMPTVVQRVAVISSATAAGYQDFMMELTRSAYRIETQLFEAIMQGDSCEESVKAALNVIEARANEFDVVAIIRGGGSTSDLECFNSYEIARAVTQMPLPVLTGIGHDKDISVTDEVAHTMLKTPTAVAQWLDQQAVIFDGKLELYAITLRDFCRQTTHAATLHLEQLATDVRHLAERTLQSEAQKLDGLQRLVENFAPERIFRLGYAIARKEGKALASVEGLEVGDTIDISLADGTLNAKVIEKTRDERRETREF